MFAVVDIAGQQFKVEKNGHYYVPKLSQEVDSEVKFESVLLLSDSKKTQVGAPNLDGVSVTAKVLEHTKDDKVIVFKKKRRKSYRKFNGHRQQLTKIEVTSIG